MEVGALRSVPCGNRDATAKGPHLSCHLAKYCNLRTWHGPNQFHTRRKYSIPILKMFGLQVGEKERQVIV